MTIDEIYKKEEISVRSYHVCKNNELHSVSDLKKYFYKNKSFEKLRNCGRKSNEELIDICNKYQDEYIEKLETETKKEKPLKNIISNLSRIQREVINSFIEENTNNLSVRSKNAISLFLNGNFKIKYFAENVLLSDTFNVSKINNVGTKSAQELEAYITLIKGIISKVHQSKKEKYLIKLRNKYLIEKKFEVVQIPDEILEVEKLFKILDYLLYQNVLFDENQTLIFNKALKLYKNQKEMSLDEIAEFVNLSRERVRQIRNICIDELFSKLLFITNINDNLFQNYGIDTDTHYIEINNYLSHKINKSNNTNFSNEFITCILSVYLKESFILIGNYEDVLLPKNSNSRARHNWNNLYLVKKELASEMDFISLVNDISKRLSQRIEEAYSFNIKSYLFKFLKRENIEILNLLLPICEKIINKEFEIYLDLNENLIFRRNTNRYTHEYAYEALENLGKPEKVEVIFKKVLELHPNYNTEEAKIRVSMKRKNGFVPIGRKSVFGLKKWEKELDGFKGGTIRQIVENYLNKFNEPKKYNDITNYVLKYRPKSNLKSIVYNLKLEDSGIFQFYQNSRIGLSCKKYEKKFVIASKSNKSERKTWEQRFEMLQNFVSTEKRLPFSKDVTKKEIKLYRWLNVQKNKQNKGKLNKNKVEKLNNLIAKYPNINGRRRLNSSKKYQELISFVSNNGRLPSANKNGEENLYQFFYKQRKLFDENGLDSSEEIKFIEVEKLLQKYKV